jgi:hypothetical protein
LTSFGTGGDLYTYDNRNSGSNYTRPGEVYELPPGTAKGSNEAKSYLAGSEYFKLKELEVF